MPKSRENVTEQPTLPLGPENFNATVNEIRGTVDVWRERGYEGATAVSRRLLHHWRSDDNVPRLFFAQVEALETLIWITEVARSDHPARVAIEDAAREHNDGGAVVRRPDAYPLFSNICGDGSGYEDRLRTLLVHSKMEGDDAISATSKLGRALKTQATQLRAAGATGDDRDIIRQDLNTVGRPDATRRSSSQLRPQPFR